MLCFRLIIKILVIDTKRSISMVNHKIFNFTKKKFDGELAGPTNWKKTEKNVCHYCYFFKCIFLFRFQAYLFKFQTCEKMNSIAQLNFKIGIRQSFHSFWYYLSLGEYCFLRVQWLLNQTYVGGIGQQIESKYNLVQIILVDEPNQSNNLTWKGEGAVV